MDNPINNPEQLEMISQLLSGSPDGNHIGETPFDIQSVLSEAVKSLSSSETISAASEYVPGTQDEDSLSDYLKSENRKEVRRFYLNYPAKDGKGQDIRLYIETETDDDDPAYINYWVGCEEYTAKRYIASHQAGLDQENPLAIVKIKHLYFYLNEIQEATK